MSLLELICRELGVEVGEEWLGSDGFGYIIKENGDIAVRDVDGFYFRLTTGEVYERIIKKSLKPVWKPEKNASYYCPNPNEEQSVDRFTWARWTNHDIDNWRFKNNLVFKTKEEAIETANKMLEAIK